MGVQPCRKPERSGGLRQGCRCALALLRRRRAGKVRCSRRVNHDPTIDFEGSNYEITPTLRKTVTLVQHHRLRFWVLELPPKDVWTPILGHFTL